jgi:hypothetical protein
MAAVLFNLDDDSWFVKPWSLDDAELLGDAAFHLVAEAGTGALTLRAVASRMGISQSWLSDRFDNRARMLAIATGVIGERWSTWVSARSRYLGIAAFLPDTDEGVVATRVWLGLVELGRVEEQTAWRVAHVRHEERSVLRHLLGATESDQRLDELTALTNGLRAAIADPIDPLRPRRARALLEQRARRG